MDGMTLIHTALSLVALASGLIVLLALLRGGPAPATTTLVYFVTSVATDITGFLLPAKQILPSHIVALLSLLLLAAAWFGRYARQLAGGWRTVDAVGISLSVYLLVFVTVAQAFSKVAALKALAPTLKEPPFAMAQGVVLLLFVVATVLAVRAVRRRPVLGTI